MPVCGVRQAAVLWIVTVPPHTEADRPAVRFQTRSSLPDEHQNQNPVHSRACLPSSHLRFFRSGPNNLPAHYSHGSKLQGHHPETPGSCWCRLPLPFLWLRSHHNSCSVARSHQFCSDTSFVAVHPHFTIPCQKECQNPRKATFFRFFPGILNNFSITRARSWPAVYRCSRRTRD